MSRVKKALHARKYRRKILKEAKGFRFDRSKKERAAQEALLHAGAYAFAHRRDKKGDFRRLWNIKISASAKELGTSYSKLMGKLKKENVAVNRKMLAVLAEYHPESFKRVANHLR